MGNNPLPYPPEQHPVQMPQAHFNQQWQPQDPLQYNLVQQAMGHQIQPLAQGNDDNNLMLQFLVLGDLNEDKIKTAIWKAIYCFLSHQM